MTAVQFGRPKLIEAAALATNASFHAIAAVGLTVYTQGACK
jgi:hypothetical protein